MESDKEISSVDMQMVAEIRATAQESADRGLLFATKWALDLVRGVAPEKRASARIVGAPPPSPPPASPARTPEHDSEEDVFVCARKSVNEKQYTRAVHLLRECQSAKARFLSTYCRYIMSEKKALRDWHFLDASRYQPPTPVNPQIAELFQSVEDVSDPWLLFLKALFLSRLSRHQEAIDCAILSIAAKPWNWSAWVLIGGCIHDPVTLFTSLEKIPLPPSHPLVQMFLVKMMNELYSSTSSELDMCNQLLTREFFPESLWIMSLRANVLYNMHSFGEAEKQCERIMEKDPYRIDDIDLFGNILYVVENKERLSTLAQFFLSVNKDRPEVCCLVGNHYSLRAEHEKAVKYFRRATELDRTFFGAWTLMGHEYIEMGNAHAATEAYRRAVDANPKDYRAWTGLGKAYGLMGMHAYALHYHYRSLKLRPDQAESWEELGHAFEMVNKYDDAIACLQRALESEAPHSMTIFMRLAPLLATVGEGAAGARYAQLAIELGEGSAQPPEYYAKALVHVADYQMRLPTGDWARAREYLERVVGNQSGLIDEATAARAADLLKAVKVRVQAKFATGEGGS
ncbi:hypothetical protein C8J57DRAFT_1167219 [Mycena rebaudengoi]|nr:hypothetical protein C8J57DRAFT_1167219 [Mycena rebaudengoi]